MCFLDYTFLHRQIRSSAAQNQNSLIDLSCRPGLILGGNGTVVPCDTITSASQSLVMIFSDVNRFLDIAIPF